MIRYLAILPVLGIVIYAGCGTTPGSNDRADDMMDVEADGGFDATLSDTTDTGHVDALWDSDIRVDDPDADVLPHRVLPAFPGEGGWFLSLVTNPQVTCEQLRPIMGADAEGTPTVWDTGIDALLYLEFLDGEVTFDTYITHGGGHPASMLDPELSWGTITDQSPERISGEMQIVAGEIDWRFTFDAVACGYETAHPDDE